MKEWYKFTESQLVESLGTDLENGLSSDEAEKRLIAYGKNEFREEAKKPFIKKLLAQFSDFLVIILIAAALISFVVGESKDAIVILAIIILNAFLGLYQEGRAEKALDALKKMTSPLAKVLRSGHVREVDASSLVPGDLVLLDAGDIIPADLRLIDASNLRIEEASLTGESIPVEKKPFLVYDEDLGIGDRKNMAYMSTFTTFGRGRGIVVETGHNTEIGKIAEEIQVIEDETTPLQKQLNNLGKFLGIATIVICIGVFGIGLIQGREILEMFMVAVSLAVAAIPEGLPAIVTIVLALGMNKMVKRNAIVKKLLAVESLGATTVICSDKTGTLTENQMTVVKVFTDNKVFSVTGTGYDIAGDFVYNYEELDNTKFLNPLLNIGVLANDAHLEKTEEGYRVIGDPTEGALITLGEKANLKRIDLNTSYPRIEEIPFDSGRKMMTTFHSKYIEDKIVSMTKGAPDIVINRSTHILVGGQVKPFDDILKNEILNVNHGFCEDALRVLAMAYREYDVLPESINSEAIENDMIFVGLVGMIDPARPEAKEAIKKCKTAGIRTIMITGDYKDTAFAIAKDLGIADSIDQAIMGSELDKLSDDDLREAVKTINVFARVSPKHKVRVVNALKENGEIVAMTGDGVNDALALKKADIGVAMGITGTDVAKNTAEMILTDDNFASIVSAVEEGRIIYSNIKKFVYFLLSCNIGEILIVFTSIVLNLPIPLLAIQLLWLNLVTDSFPALALGVENPDPDIMTVKPRDPKEPILDKLMLRGILFQSFAVAGASLLAYWWGLKTYGSDITKVRTIIFATLITAELLRAFSSRSLKHSLFKIGFFSNITMVYSVSFAFFLLLIVIYLPFLQPVFHTEFLGTYDWSIILSLAFIPLIAGEVVKIFSSKK